MPEPRRALSSLSFIVRFWLERTPSHTLRGRITRVSAQGPDEQRAVTGLEDVTRFIEASLEREGVSVKPAAQPDAQPDARPVRCWRWPGRAGARGRR